MISNYCFNSTQEQIKENLLYFLSNKKNPSASITFNFIDEKLNFNQTITIDYFCDFKFKGLNLFIIPIDKQIDIIVSNLHFEGFNFVECFKYFGKTECHGHGDFWGDDKFLFLYRR